MGRHNNPAAGHRRASRNQHAQGPERRGSRHHSHARRAPRRALLRPRFLVVGAAVAVLAVLVVPPVVDRVVPGCQNGVRLTVAADPAVAPAVSAASNRLRASDARVDGRCIDVDVQELEPARVAAALRTGEAAELRPDVWVPDSSAWVARTRQTAAGARRLVGGNPSIARSPLALAMPKPVAEQRGWPEKPLGWKTLLNELNAQTPVRMGLADPTTSSTALAALSSLEDVAAASEQNTDDFSSAAFLVQLRRKLAAVAPDPEALLARNVSVFPALEQSVWRINSQAPTTPLVAVYPEEGAPAADFPFATLRAPWGDAATSAAAQTLLTELKTKRAERTLSEQGLRTPDGSAGAFASDRLGLAAEHPQRQPLPDPASLDDALQAWNVAGRQGRILAVLDVSGSMAEPVEGTDETRLDLAKEAAVSSIGLFDDSTELGVWQFSTAIDGAKDYEEVVPTGPLAQRVGSGSRALTAEDAIEDLDAINGGGTGLYDTALAAYDQATKDYSPDLVNLVVLLTDGRNDDPSSVSKRKLLNQVEAAYDPKQPVRFLTIAYGTEAEVAVLSDLAEATEGRSYVSEDPADIRKVFLDAITES